MYIVLYIELWHQLLHKRNLKYNHLIDIDDIDDDDNDIEKLPSNKTPQLDDPMFPAC